MNVKARTSQRFVTVAVLLVGGGLITIGAWVGGDRGLAVGLTLFYAVAAVVTFIWAGGQGDVAAMLRRSADERQRSIDLRAAAISGFAMAILCIAGTAVDLARGGSGMPWSAVAGVGGASYAIAVGTIARRA
jgi:hypothetical protein